MRVVRCVVRVSVHVCECSEISASVRVMVWWRVPAFLPTRLYRNSIAYAPLEREKRMEEAFPRQYVDINHASARPERQGEVQREAFPMFFTVSPSWSCFIIRLLVSFDTVSDRNGL